MKFRSHFVRAAALLCCLLTLGMPVLAAEVDCDSVYCFSGADFTDQEQFTGVCITDLPDAATGTVLKATSSVFVLLIVCVGGRRLPRWQETAAILVCTAGTWLLCTHGDFSTMQLAPLALFFGLSSAFGNALYTVLSTRLLKGNDPWAVIGGAIFLAGVIFCTVSPPWHTPVSWDMPLFGCVAGIVVIGTVGGYMLHLIGTGMVGPVTGILLAKNETVTSIILSVLVLGRRFAVADYLGFVMVLGSVILISVSRARQTDG